MEANTILTNILNRLEDKVDKMSKDISVNTTITDSHTKMLSEMKGVHDINAKIILETRDEVKGLNNTVVNIISWKNGQTKAMENSIEDIKKLHERLIPIEQDYLDRKDKKKEVQAQTAGFAWKLAEKVIFAIIGAILISWKTIIENINKII